MEIEYAFLTEKPNFNKGKDYSLHYIELHKEEIIREYNKFINLYKSQHHENALMHQRLQQSFANKTCINCGGKLRYIHGYDFWGCVNYLDGKEHRSFSGENPEIKLDRVNVKTTWIIDVMKQSGIRGKVKSNILLNWLQDNGYPDPYQIYGYGKTIDHLNGWAIARERTTKLENAALFYLMDIYPKVLYQQCIAYKLKGKKETFCIPDYIVSNDKEVRIVDAKLQTTNDEQIALYVALVGFIMNGRKDKRKLTGAYIMDEVSDWNFNTPYEIIYLNS